MAEESICQKRKEVATPGDVAEEKSAKKPFVLAEDEVYFDGSVMKLTDFRPIKGAPAFSIMRDGRVKSPSGNVRRHFLQLRRVTVFIDTLGFDPKPDPTATSEWRDVRGHKDLQFNANTGEFRNGVSSKGSLQILVKCNLSRPNCPIDLALEETWCRPDERLFAEEIQNLTFQYNDLDLDFECAFTIPPTRRRQLLIVQRPDLISLYSIKNEDRKIGLIFLYSATDYIWFHDVCGHEFTMSPEVLVKRVNPCADCISRSPAWQERDATGDAVEIYFTAKLQAAAGVESAIRTGHKYNGKDDGLVKLLHEIKTHPVQYKFMHHTTAERYTVVCEMAKYPTNMLLAATNQNRDRFWVGLFSDVVSSKQSLSITFTPRSKVHLANKFTNEAAAIKAIVDLLPSSLDEADFKDEDRYGKSNLVEKKMCEEFRAKAESLGLKCKDHDKLHSPIDFFCNGKSVQAKHTPCESKGTSVVGSRKPYTSDDGIDVFIVQVTGFDSQFLIIPIAVLVECGYIKTKTQAGTLGFCVPAPDYRPCISNTKIEKLIPYWNAWHVLGEPASTM